MTRRTPSTCIVDCPPTTARKAPMRSPLPVRDGVNATRLHLPLTGPWATIQDYVLERFGHVDPDGIRERFAAGEVVALGGIPVTGKTPLGAHEFIWYYRSPPAETPIPYEAVILHEDAHLVAVDKPPFLPTTPGGRFLQETALVRLRRLLDEPDLTPLHRLDRLTWGVVLFVKDAESRGPYQQLFERRTISKSYEAIAPAPRGELRERLEAGSVVVENRLAKIRTHLRAFEEEGPVNARSEVELLRELDGGRALYRLTPHTGKTHQLRLHMASLGLGIENDPFYPTLLDEAADDHSRPLKLLARSISFRDPLSGEERRFASGFSLECPENLPCRI